MERIELIELKERRARRKRISWGSIFAGTTIVLAVSMLLILLGTSVGLFMVNPTDSEPFSGVGTTMGIWIAISILIGLACGGFVAGKLAGADGMIHGLVVWGVTMIAGAFLVGSITVGAVRVTSKVLGAAGTIVSGAGNVVQSGASALMSQAQDVFGTIDFDANPEEMRADVRQALRRSGVREFQPEYLRGQYRAVSNDLRRTVRRVVANPQQAGDLVNGFGNRLQQRMDTFANNINKQDVVRLVANNSNLSNAEAENMVDQYIELIEQGRERLSNLQENVREALDEWDEVKANALDATNRGLNRAAWGGIIAFIAFVLGALAAGFCGMFGTRKTDEGVEA